jgi:TolB protein
MRRACVLVLLLGLQLDIVSTETPAAVGGFEGHADIGTVEHPGAAVYDAGRRTYTVKGSGENMWSTADAFHFVWKRMSGDVSIAADVTLRGTGTQKHRKAVLMIRQSLDADSAYVDAALHGNGLTSLQFRDRKGDATHEVQANIERPTRLRLEKRGKYVTLFLGSAGASPTFSGAAVRIILAEPFYVGIGVCAHNKNETETATFSHVEIGAAPASAARSKRYSTLETQSMASTDRRVVRVVASDTAPSKIDPGFAVVCNDNGLSPDGTTRVSLAYENDAQPAPGFADATLQRESLKTGSVDVIARFLAPRGSGIPCWSSDSRQIAFTTYQLVSR